MTTPFIDSSIRRILSSTPVSTTTLILITTAAFVTVIVIAAFGKRHARRLQRERKIRIDRFKLKRRHAEIELEVFGSREVVQAVQQYARDHHVSIEAASKQAH